MAQEGCSCLVGCEVHSNFGSLFVVHFALGRTGLLFRGHPVHVACKQIIFNFVLYDLHSVK